jgi:nitrogenase iron protein NifH
MPANRIAIYGKGGIGKSTVATNLSVLFAQAGLKVLHVGCDPKRDSSMKLLDGPAPPTVLEAMAAHGDRVKLTDIVAIGRHGVEFVEAGGPEPGVGCAGRGVAMMIERLDELKLVEKRGYDVVLYDVLGDVVCGGFAAPLRKGIGREVYVVTSEEPMALFAANNIARAVVRYAGNGVVLGGLIVNLRERGPFRDTLEAFARRLGTRVLAFLERDPLVRQAEYQFRTVVEVSPQAPISVELRRLAGWMSRQCTEDAPPLPTPMQQHEFVDFVRQHFAETPPLQVCDAACAGAEDGS